MLFVLAMMAQFQFWDGIMTHVFVNNGIVKEANHLVAPLVAGGDFLLVKLIGIVVLFWLLWTVFKHLPGVAFVTASYVAVLYFAVVTWNFVVLFSLAL
jgi:hypothetical protein